MIFILMTGLCVLPIAGPVYLLATVTFGAKTADEEGAFDVHIVVDLSFH